MLYEVITDGATVTLAVTPRTLAPLVPLHLEVQVSGLAVSYNFV